MTRKWENDNCKVESVATENWCCKVKLETRFVVSEEPFDKGNRLFAAV